jgi:HEPN domain-containing protein
MKNKTRTWLELAENGLSLAEELLRNRREKVYYIAHFCHQSIEKLLKAIIAERTDKVPPPTHNFKILFDWAKLEDMPEEKKRFIFGLTPHYIGTKYPENIPNLYKQYTKPFVKKNIRSD